MINESMLQMERNGIFTIENLKKVYELFSDDVSKGIFTDRLLWYVTGEGRYIQNLVDKYTNETLKSIGSIYEGGIDKFADKCIQLSGRLVVYGAGVWGTRLLTVLRQMGGGDNIVVCDKKAEKGLQEYMGYQVIKPEQLLQKYADAYIVIATIDYPAEIAAFLRANGIRDEKILYMHKKTGIMWYDLYNQYFDPDIMISGDAEVFVDCGYFHGETTERFIEWCNDNYEKIVAFEMDDANWKCNTVDDEKVKLYPYAVWDSSKELRFSSCDSSSRIHAAGDKVIQAETIDNILQGDRVSFIKMDIEGAELRALIGARNTIMKWKPRLAICIYHKAEDILTIPSLIHELVPEYRIYLRHYLNYQNETVLYAVL